jgi:hypothetical protein
VVLKHVYVAIVRKIDIGLAHRGDNLNPEMDGHQDGGTQSKGQIKPKVKAGGAPSSQGASGRNAVNPSKDRVWFCKDFQKEKCRIQE